MKELVYIQAKLKAPKNNRNEYGKYNYRSCEDILKAAKEHIEKQKCVLLLSDEVLMVGNRFYIKATATITNEAGESVSVSALAREEDTKKGMDASQITGTASSYARKYALNGLFAIDNTKDADALNTSPEYTQPVSNNGGDKCAKYEDECDTQMLLQIAKDDLVQANSKEDLKEIVNKYPTLRNNPDFLTAGTARRKALGIQ